MGYAAPHRTLEHADPAVDVGLAPRVHERPGQPHDAVLPVLFRRRLLHVPLASLNHRADRLTDRSSQASVCCGIYESLDGLVTHGDDVAVAPGDVVTAGEEGAHGVEEPADLGDHGCCRGVRRGRKDSIGFGDA